MNISLNMENYYFLMDYQNIKKSPNLNFSSEIVIWWKSGLFPGARLILPYYTIYTSKNEKKWKVKLVLKTNKKAFHMNLAPGFQSLSSHIVQFHMIVYIDSSHIFLWHWIHLFITNWISKWVLYKDNHRLLY